MLNTVLHGSPTDRPPLLIVHGLFGSARNWGAIARRLSEDRLVITLDQRNHGDSPWLDRHGYEEMAADIAEVIRAHVDAPAGQQIDVVGHSMGGKAVMQLALTEGQLIRRLIVADIAPVAYRHTQMPLVHAMRDMDLSNLSSRGEADRRLAASVEDPGTRAFLLQSLDLKADPPRWKLNLEVLGAEMPRILSWPGTEGTFEGPTLFLTGALSTYVSSEDRPAIKALFPNAKFAKLPGAGHWLHADRPREFEAAVATFLA
ncbi:alpha/beta fold hydrolase [Frigidibacter sp. MR17.14]|uniref:alpha/beta fold hydrolase n=1 Tax=Frigidibacter sp. MR17.14 TaxID=3126509 RepID=UPI003012A5AF